uniref:Rep_fac-A_C domain-containing protein n=1 Tax=Strongyloides papillosus TaxID=174720 RepID=A0A0N5BMQ0_STREA
MVKTGFSSVPSPKGPCEIFNFYIVGEDGVVVSLKCFNDTRPEVFGKVRENVFYVLRGPGSAIRNASDKFNRTGHSYDILVNDDVFVEEYGGQPPFTLSPATVKSLRSTVERVGFKAISIQEARSRLGTTQGPEEIFSVVGTFGQIKGSPFYRACLNQRCCKTRVRERGPGSFFCPKCRTDSGSCTFGFLVGFELVAGTEAQWVCAVILQHRCFLESQLK